MVVNETVDQLIKDEMEQACDNIEFLRDCIALPSFTNLTEDSREYTRRTLEYQEKRLEALKQYFSLPENLTVPRSPEKSSGEHSE